MVVEELIAKLGFKGDNGREAANFLKQLEKIKKATKDLGKGIKVNLTGNTSGLARIGKDFDKATAAMRRYRQEAEKIGRLRPGGGYGPGFGPGGLSRGNLNRERARAAGHGAVGGALGVGGFGTPRERAAARRAERRRPSLGADVAEASLAGAGIGLGRAGAIAGGAYGTGRLIHAATKSSMSFERAMIEVSKATDAKGSELQKYSDGILRLARDTGQNKEDLAGVLAAAGFAGRPANELMRFTEYGAKATKAWGTSTETTGQSMAEIGNIYQADQAEIERIGDQINTMADKSASKEADLLEIIRRVGGTGKTAGMSSGDVLAFGAGLKERGVQTEVAASGIETYINFLKLGEEYSKGADDGLKALGYTSDKLRKSFVKSPTQTAIQFLEKIAGVTDPMKRAEVLTGIFGKERQDDVERMASAVPKIKEFIALMGTPANYKGSVMGQFAEQMKADVNKIDQSTQQLDVLLKRLGDPMKQALGAGAERLNKGLDYLDDRTGNKAAKPSNVYDDLPGLDHLRHGPTAADFNERWNAVPAQAPRMTFLPNAGTGIPDIAMLKGKGKKRTPSLGYGNAGTGAAPTFSPQTFGIGGANSADWMNKGVKETTTSQITNNTTNNTNVGNDQRTQSASVTVNASGLEQVAAQVLASVKSGLSSLGPSIAKGNTTPTAPTLTGP